MLGTRSGGLACYVWVSKDESDDRSTEVDGLLAEIRALNDVRSALIKTATDASMIARRSLELNQRMEPVVRAAVLWSRTPSNPDVVDYVPVSTRVEGVDVSGKAKIGCHSSLLKHLIFFAPAT